MSLSLAYPAILLLKTSRSEAVAVGERVFVRACKNKFRSLLTCVVWCGVVRCVWCGVRERDGVYA